MNDAPPAPDDEQALDREPQADVTCRRIGEDGYDLGVHAHAEVGTVDVGVAVEGATGTPQSLGVFVDAPQVGRVTVALTLEPDGSAQVASVTRFVRGQSAVSVPRSRDDLIADIKRLELELARERRGLAAAEVNGRDQASEAEELRARLAGLEETTVELREANARLSDERDAAQADVARLQQELEERSQGAAEQEQRSEELLQLTADLGEAKAREAALELRSQTAEHQVSELTAELEQQSAGHSDLREELSAARAGIADLEAQVIDLTRQLELLTSGSSAPQTTANDELQAELERERELAASARAEVELARTGIEAERLARAQAAAELAELHSMMEVVAVERDQLAARCAQLEAAQTSLAAQPPSPTAPDEPTPSSPVEPFDVVVPLPGLHRSELGEHRQETTPYDLEEIHRQAENQESTSPGEDDLEWAEGGTDPGIRVSQELAELERSTPKASPNVETEPDPLTPYKR